MNAPGPDRKILLNPGPGTTSATVKDALVVSDICPREGTFGEVVQEVRRGLVRLAKAERTHEAVLIPGPGTCGVEAVLHQIAARGKRLCLLVNGAYGERAVQMAGRLGIRHTVVRRGWMERLKLEDLSERAGVEDPEAVFWVHHETSTGLLNPLEPLAGLCRERGWTSIVDGMSSFGGIPMEGPLGGVDVLVSSSNKCLQGMPGLSLVLARREWLEEDPEALPATLGLDLREYWKGQRERGEFPFTPPVQVVYALRQALRETEAEGVAPRRARYRRQAGRLLEGMTALGFEPLLREADQGYILLSFRAHAHPEARFEKLHDALWRNGITLYPAKSGMEEGSFRMAVIGDLTDTDIEQVLSAVGAFLKEVESTAAELK